MDDIGRNTAHFTQLPNEIVFDKRVTGMAVKLLAALEDYCGSKNVCWPSQRTLAALLSVSERYIRKLVKLLADLGIISFKRGGYGRPNYYTLLKRVARREAAPVRNKVTAYTGPTSTAEPYPINNNHFNRAARRFEKKNSGGLDFERLKRWENTTLAIDAR